MLRVFSSCWETLLKIATLAHVIDFDLGQQGQQPLKLPSANTHLPHVNTQGVFFAPQNATKSTFTCQYPTLGNDWQSCNSASDRSCWLKNTKTGDKYDIRTDCKS